MPCETFQRDHFYIFFISCKALLLLAVTGQGSNLKLYPWSLRFESDSRKGVLPTILLFAYEKASCGTP